MASADQTISGAIEFEADGTQHTATLNSPGGWVYTTAAGDAVINPDAGDISTTQPSGAGSVRLPGASKGQMIPLPHTCRAFTFKAAASTFIQYIPRA